MAVAFNSSENYVLENEHVIIRPLLESDAAEFFPLVEHEADIWKYSLMPVTTVDQMSAYFKQAVEARQAGKEYPFIVIDKKSNRFAGSTRFYDIQVNADTVQLGYTWYGKQFQQTGLNRQCKLLLFSFAFEQCGFERVELRADLRNERSIAAMKKIGCIEEGILRSNLRLPDGGRRDSIILSILKNEWNTSVKEKLIQLIR